MSKFVKACVKYIERHFSKVYRPAECNLLTIGLLSSLFVSSCSTLNLYEKQSEPDTPNILLIVVDDMGTADLGIFGGEISTPNLDNLAKSGVIFTNFHTSPVCSATRAMLLTGVDNHLSGFGNMAEERSFNQKGKPGYEGELNDRVITLATILHEQGYRTYISGKWHLGMSEKSSPTARGFDRSFAMLAGGASHYSDMRPAYHPDPDGVAPYRQDGKMLKSLPEEFEYSTQFYTDKMIEYIGETDSNSPFFAYLAYTAPHWPLQAPERTVKKYKGTYEEGYKETLKRRLARQKQLGIVPDTARPNPPTIKSAEWDSLSNEDKLKQIRTMEIYAAMVDEIDQHVGRMIQFLVDQDLLENTIIIFLSDNGAEGHDLDETWPADMFPSIRHNIDTRHDFSYENMGKPNSYVLYGPDWARSGNPAFRLHKGFPTEGGTRVPAFITYPKHFKSRKIDHYVSVLDLMPTLLEHLNISHPSQTSMSSVLQPISGVSVLSSLRGRKSQTKDKDRIVVGEILGKYFVRKGDWKLVYIPSPYGPSRWELFNLSEDLAETNDLSDIMPEKVAELEREWADYVKLNNVILPDWVSGY